MHSDDDCYASDGGGESIVVISDAEEWQDYHSEFLVTLWHNLVDETSAMGVSVLDKCTFSDFTQFCFEHSSGHKPPC